MKNNPAPLATALIASFYSSTGLMPMPAVTAIKLEPGTDLNNNAVVKVCGYDSSDRLLWCREVTEVYPQIMIGLASVVPSAPHLAPKPASG